MYSSSISIEMKDSTLHRAELDALVASGLKLEYLYSQPKDKRRKSRKVSEDLLRKYLTNSAGTQVYCCAPEGFIEATKAYCETIGLPSQQFHYEQFFAEAVDRSEGASETYTVQFAQSGNEITIRGNQTLLEAAREAGIPVVSGCEKGLCKSCVVTKVRGTTQIDGESDKRITICNSLPNFRHRVRYLNQGTLAGFSVGSFTK